MVERSRNANTRNFSIGLATALVPQVRRWRLV